MENKINVDIAVIYHWYDHQILRHNGDAKIVEEAIENGDYDTFIKIYNKYPSYTINDKEFGECEVVYFPDTADILYKDQIIGEIYITEPIGFSMITDSSYECG